jgi:hypothetical protein
MWTCKCFHENYCNYYIFNMIIVRKFKECEYKIINEINIVGYARSTIMLESNIMGKRSNVKWDILIWRIE